jgi:hypothetical protein
MFGRIFRLLLSRGSRSFGSVVALSTTWTAWGTMPERPLREWQIAGPFGGSGVVNRSATEAAIHASTREMDPSFREQISGIACFSNSDSPTADFESGYRVDLNTGQFTRVYHVVYHPFQVSGRPYLIFDREDEAAPPAPWPTAWDRDDIRWVLRDAETDAVIASQNCDPKTYVSKPSYSGDRRWVTVSEDRTDSSGDLPRQIRKWLRRNFSGASWSIWLRGETRNTHLCIFDAKTGARVNDVPSWEVAGWTAAGDQFWTIDNIHAVDWKLCGVTCRLWSAWAASPPWWLWVLTGAGVLLTAWDNRLHRFSCAFASPNCRASIIQAASCTRPK